MQPETEKQTEKKVAKQRVARIWFYFAVIALVLSVWGVQVYKYKQIFGAQGTGTVVSESSTIAASSIDWQKMLIEAMTETNALLTTLATALLGGLGLLVANKKKDGTKSPHLISAFLTAVGGCLSLYFGYVSHLNLLAMIGNQVLINPYDPVYLFSSHAQFYTLLAGAFFLADFAVHDLSERN